MIDRCIYCTCNKISPEAPVPVHEMLDEKQMLGGDVVGDTILTSLIAWILDMKWL